jgi:hypothetical protein
MKHHPVLVQGFFLMAFHVIMMADTNVKLHYISDILYVKVYDVDKHMVYLTHVS